MEQADKTKQKMNRDGCSFKYGINERYNFPNL